MSCTNLDLDIICYKHRSDTHIILVGQNVVDHIRALKGELEEKKDEVQYLQSLNETLLVKEHMSKSELLDARQVLLSVRIS